MKSIRLLKGPATAAALAVVMGFGLSACKGESTSKVLEPDWIHNTEPTPKESPEPTPSGSPTDLYTGPAEVAKYVQKFIDDGKAQGVDVIPDMASPKLQIRIASLDSWGSSVIGLCETGGLRRVTFDPDFWNSVSETQREILAHHELGHCVLYRGHNSKTLLSGAVASIMYPQIMASSTYLNNIGYYLDELFSYAGQAPAQLAARQAAASVEKPQSHVCDSSHLPHLQE